MEFMCGYDGGDFSPCDFDWFSDDHDDGFDVDTFGFDTFGFWPVSPGYNPASSPTYSPVSPS
jgi:hypothetical protein